jgi:AcrR family transcriptional regulator
MSERGQTRRGEARGHTARERPRAPRKRNARGEGERLRAALMEAATELLLEHGNADSLSIRSVTARAGVSPTALYLHFADMDELVRAVCDAAFEELGTYLRDAAAAHAGEPRAQLQAMGSAYVEFAQQRPGLYRILFATPGRLGLNFPPGTPSEDPGMAALDALVQATAGSLGGREDAFAVALQLWTALHGFISLRAVMPVFDWPSTDDFLRELYRAHLGE